MAPEQKISAADLAAAIIRNGLERRVAELERRVAELEKCKGAAGVAALGMRT